MMRWTVSMALTLAGLALALPHPAAQAPGGVTAIVGGTIVDGNGGPPMADAVVLIAGGRITAVGSRSDVRIQESALAVRNEE